jgi:hypothetical protein
MEPFWELPWGEQPRFGARAWECEPSEAQQFLNVPLLLPDESELPEGLSLAGLSIRPEGPERWSSVRMILAGRGRRLRLKQYHFDWWRPTELAAGLRRTMGFYRVGEQVAAWGRDRRGRSAASMAWGRTTIEVSIEQGTFAEIELRHLLARMRPAVPPALQVLAASPFHKLSYHTRRGYGPYGIDELAAASWVGSLPAAAAIAPSPLLVPGAFPQGWHFDAAAVWPEPPPVETQWLLRDTGGMAVFYARARPSSSTQPLKLPAVYRIQEGWQARQVMLRRRRTTLALQHPDLGGWSAAWAENGHRYQIWVRAGSLPGARAFRDLLERLVAIEI